MRSRFLASWLLGLLVVSLVPGARAQEATAPVDESAPADSEDSDSEQPEAMLLIETDSPCTLWINGLVEGELLPDTPREIGVDSGAVEVKATSISAPEAAWTETYEIEKGARLEVAVEMVETLEDFRKLERRERIYPDFDTRLMWPIRDNGWDLTWKAAARHCRALELGGFQDWRLPTIEELDEVQAMWSLAEYKTVAEIRLSACCPWSSNKVDETHALNYSFRFRRPFPGHLDHSYDMRALCVRDASAEISDDPKEIARQRKAQKEKRKERDKKKAEKEARRKGV